MATIANVGDINFPMILLPISLFHIEGERYYRYADFSGPPPFVADTSLSEVM